MMGVDILEMGWWFYIMSENKSKYFCVGIMLGVFIYVIFFGFYNKIMG